MKMIIGGVHVDASNGQTQDVLNPANGNVIDTVPAATKEDIDLALDNAVKGFEEWSEYPLHRRIAILRKAADLLDENGEKVAQLMKAEQGKLINQARGEIKTSSDRTRVLVESAELLEGKSIQGDNFAGTTGNLITIIRQPLGVVAAFIPFNFPLAELIANVVPALVMGNSVVIKPSSETPLTGIAMTEIFLEAGVPANAVQIVTGSGSRIGNLLSGDERIAAATMTGSTAVGSEIGMHAVKNIKHISLELGGNDAFVIMEDADLDQAVAESINARIWNCGQMCCGSKRLLVHNSIKEAFEEKLIAVLKTKKLGDPDDTTADVGPMVSEKAANTVQEQVNKTVEQGGKVLLGGHKLENAYFEITVMEATKNSDVATDMEIFGPVWTVIGYDTKEEALEIANSTMYGLSAGVLGKNINDLMWFAKRVQAGACVVNGNGKFVGPNSPFGGWKKSGIGRRDAVSSLVEMSQEKVIAVKCNW